MILKNIDLQVYRGEFLCVIGDVGSGKSSLLSALIGDMIYVPDEEIEAFGGLDKEAKPKAFSKLKKTTCKMGRNVHGSSNRQIRTNFWQNSYCKQVINFNV